MKIGKVHERSSWFLSSTDLQQFAQFNARASVLATLLSVWWLNVTPVNTLFRRKLLARFV